jgi:hypothetical protein
MPIPRVRLDVLVEDVIKAIAPGSQDYYGVRLREMSRNLHRVAENPKIWPEFAEMYGLPKPKKTTIVDKISKDNLTHDPK